MKINPRMALSLAAGIGMLAAAPVLAQTTYTWTNQLGGNIATAANWDPNGQPSGATQDTALFDGRTTGPLTITGNATGLPSTGFGSLGINLVFSESQISSVTFTSSIPAGSAAYGVKDITINSPSAAITFGNPGIVNYQYNFFGRPAADIHYFVNNSSQPATINGNVRWQAGGGNAYTLDFGGTGNWNVNNYLVNDNNAGMIITVTGPGTTTWTPGGYLGNSGIDSPITLNGGKLVLKASHPRINDEAWANNATFEFDAPGHLQTLSGAISGSGTNIVTAGTLTLSSGASSYTGDTILRGGTLIAGGAENVDLGTGPLGTGGTISFNGGTLGFSVNNTFDYSPRFNTAAGQIYSFDTRGQNVTLSNDLTSAGATLSKSGPGKLTLAGASTYSGTTTNSSGKLVFQGSKTGTGSIISANGTALGVTATGTQVTPSSLTVGTSGSATLEFNNVNSTATAILAPTTLSAGGPIDINVGGGAFAVGQNYPLLSWTSGSTPAVNLGYVIGGTGTLNTNGNSIRLNVNALSYVWDGVSGMNWTDANNWRIGGSPVTYANPNPVLFDDSAAGGTDVTVVGVVQPGNFVFNNSTKSYTVTSSSGNNIGGTASLIKVGSGTATLSGGFNTFTGPSSLFEGTVSVGTLANGGVASDIGASGSGAANLVFNGGALQYTGAAANIDRLFTLGTGGGIIDASGLGALNLNNAGLIGLSGSGSRVLTLTGTNTENNTLAGALADSGGATALTKGGAGKWVLTGTNDFSGGTTIAGGVLQVGNGGSSGTIGSGAIINNGGLAFNRSGSVTVSGAISGTGSLTNDGSGTVILTGDNSYSGNTVINAGTLQAGNGGATGTLPSGTPIINNGTLIYNTTGLYVSAGFFATHSGVGNVHVKSGFVKAIGQNTYTGWTLIDPGAVFQPTEGNAGNLQSSVVTNNGTLVFGRQDNSVWGYTNNIVGTGQVLKEVNNTQGGGDVTLAGTNSYTGGTLIAGGGLILGDGINPASGTIVGPVIFTNSLVGDNPRFLRFERPDDFAFTNDITTVTVGAFPPNVGRLEKYNGNTVTITGNNSLSTGGVTVNAGTLIAGNGGTGGGFGSGDMIIDGTFIYNRSANHTVNGVVSGGGFFVKAGTGSLTLAGNDTFFGTMSVSNGTLYVNGNSQGAGPLNVNGGTLGGSGTFAGPIILDPGTTLAPGPSATTVGTFTANAFVDIQGNVAVKVNRSLVQSNDFVEAIGGVQKTGAGTLTVANVGPTAIAAGDKFTLFSQPVTGGEMLTVTGAGATWQNNLATDGSITALTAGSSPVNPNPPVMQVSVSANTLSLAWPTNLGWTLQTNGAALTAANQWFAYPGSELLTNVNLTIDRTKTNVFFRMVLPSNP